MTLKDLLLTVRQGKQEGENALLNLLNTPRYDKHIKHLKDPQVTRHDLPKVIKAVQQQHAQVQKVTQQPAQSSSREWAQRLAQARQDAAGGSASGYGITGDPTFKRFIDSIAQQESNFNYSAVGVPTRSGTALGKYQVLDSNIDGPGGWDKEVLGRDISSQEFLNSPQLQEKVAQTKLAAYYKDYGAAGAAKAWYGGPGAVRNSNAPQYGGPSINGYANSVVGRMR